MRIIAPVTDYIPASILTTLNDIVVRGVADPERLAEVNWRGFYHGVDNMAASGTKVITGVGFRPRMVVFFAVDSVAANLSFSIGFDNGTLRHCIYQESAHAAIRLDGNYILYIQRGGGNQIVASITALSNDGFSLTYTLAGACGSVGSYWCIP